MTLREELNLLYSENTMLRVLKHDGSRNASRKRGGKLSSLYAKNLRKIKVITEKMAIIEYGRKEYNYNKMQKA